MSAFRSSKKSASAIRNALVVYKKSVFEIFHVKRMAQPETPLPAPTPELLKHFRNCHDVHYRSLDAVGKALSHYQIPYCVADRKRTMSYDPFDLIITVGGDGTLLNAQAHVTNQLVLGVNSNPEVSVGRFCCVGPTELPKALDLLVKGQADVRLLNRMSIAAGQARAILALNDLLICHRNPAAMSHYTLTAGRVTEHQRSSGIWVSTAAGSTGAIQSAGGKPMPLLSRDLQYKPRELYWKKNRPYKLSGGRVSGSTGMSVTSHMEDGMIYVDGSRVVIPFTYGKRVSIKSSKNRLQVVDFRNRLEANHLKR